MVWLATTFEEQQALSRKYRCYRINRENSNGKQVRYVTEICDISSGRDLVNENHCEIMMIHFKLFKGSDRLADIESILDEADSIIQREKIRTFPKFKLKDISPSD